MLSKNVNNEKCAPKWIFSMKKKNEKDSDNFWHSKLTLKVKRFGDFALFDTSPLTQFSKFNNFLWVGWFLGKNLSNLVGGTNLAKLNNPYCHSKDIDFFLYLQINPPDFHIPHDNFTNFSNCQIIKNQPSNRIIKNSFKISSHCNLYNSSQRVLKRWRQFSEQKLRFFQKWKFRKMLLIKDDGLIRFI